MTTLKELKAKYPQNITTSGCVYHIDGFGQYKQRNTIFGLETYRKNWNDEWSRIDFQKELNQIEHIYNN